MFEATGRMFFTALRDAMARRLGADHPCLCAVERAIDAGDADATVAVQEVLNTLGPELISVLMADVHKALRENPAAILDNWRPHGSGH